MDVGIDGKRWVPKRLRHHDARRFMAYAGQRFKFLKRLRNLSAMVTHQLLRKPYKCLGFLGGKPQGLNQLLHTRDR